MEKIIVPKTSIEVASQTLFQALEAPQAFVHLTSGRLVKNNPEVLDHKLQVACGDLILNGPNLASGYLAGNLYRYSCFEQELKTILKIPSQTVFNTGKTISHLADKALEAGFTRGTLFKQMVFRLKREDPVLADIADSLLDPSLGLPQKQFNEAFVQGVYCMQLLLKNIPKGQIDGLEKNKPTKKLGIVPEVRRPIIRSLMVELIFDGFSKLSKSADPIENTSNFFAFFERQSFNEELFLQGKTLPNHNNYYLYNLSSGEIQQQLQEIADTNHHLNWGLYCFYQPLINDPDGSKQLAAVKSITNTYKAIKQQLGH